MVTDFEVIPVPDGVAALSIQVRELVDGLALQISGELDFFSARALTGVVEGCQLDGRRRVVLDLAGLRFCDAGGVTALLRAHTWVRGRGGQLQVRGVSGLPRRVVALVGLDKVLDVD